MSSVRIGQKSRKTPRSILSNPTKTLELTIRFGELRIYRVGELFKVK